MIGLRLSLASSRIRSMAKSMLRADGSGRPAWMGHRPKPHRPQPLEFKDYARAVADSAMSGGKRSSATMELVDLERGKQDRKLFEIPAGYNVMPMQ